MNRLLLTMNSTAKTILLMLYRLRPLRGIHLQKEEKGLVSVFLAVEIIQELNFVMKNALIAIANV